MVCSKEGAEAVPRTSWPIGRMSDIPRHPRLFCVLLVVIDFFQCFENRHGTDPVPNLANRLN